VDQITMKILVDLIATYEDLEFPALRCIGSLVFGSRAHALTPLQYDALPHFKRFLSKNSNAFAYETCWILSNLARCEYSIQLMFDMDIFPAVFLQLSAEWDNTRYQALACISEAVIFSTDFQLIRLADQGCVSTLCQALDSSRFNEESLKDALSSLHRILPLNNVEHVRKCLFLVKQNGGVEKLNSLRYHGSAHVCAMANEVVNVMQSLTRLVSANEPKPSPRSHFSK
jgi:hypothetical protein